MFRSPSFSVSRYRLPDRGWHRIHQPRDRLSRLVPGGCGEFGRMSKRVFQHPRVALLAAEEDDITRQLVKMPIFKWPNMYKKSHVEIGIHQQKSEKAMNTVWNSVKMVEEDSVPGFEKCDIEQVEAGSISGMGFTEQMAGADWHIRDDS